MAIPSAVSARPVVDLMVSGLGNEFEVRQRARAGYSTRVRPACLPRRASRKPEAASPRP